MQDELKPNPNKKLIIKVDGVKYARYPIKTKLITPGTEMVDFVAKNVRDYVRSGDMVVFSEKATAVAQNRAYPVETIKPSRLARFLVKFTTKSDKGIGISSPETFQLALDDCGVARIILATLCAAVTRIFGIRGVFYYIAGEKAALIDGAADYVCPPYNRYVSKGPDHCEELCVSIAQKLIADVIVAVVDINDYGGRVVQKGSAPLDKKLITQILIDNPLGQSREMTPIGILRKIQISK